MSHLRLFSPESPETNRSFFQVVPQDTPDVIPFPVTLRLQPSFFSAPAAEPVAEGTLNLVDRARLIYANRTCPHCRYPVVELIEDDDATFNRVGQPIPGTSTLLGFRCTACDAEWTGRRATSLPRRRQANIR